MHVLITSDTVGGVWTYTQELVTGLVRAGHRITLVSFGRLPSPHQAAWVKALPEVDYRPTEFRLEWMEVAERDIEESRHFLELLVSEARPDVLHLNQYCYGDLPVDVPRIVVAHSDVVSWWVGVHGCEPADTPWIRNYRKHVTEGLRGADLVVAPSQWMLDAVRHHYLRPANGTVIYNGRTPELFDCIVEKLDFALSVGRVWDPGKHLSLLLDREWPWEFRIAGWTHEPGRETRESPAQIPASVQFIGPKSQDELRNLYASAPIYVATSRYEPFGLSPLEAALSRCTLVMNDIPVFHELWGDAVLYFRRNDPDDLARVLRELRRNSEMRNEHAGRVLTFAREKFSAARMVEEYERAYADVCALQEVA